MTHPYARRNLRGRRVDVNVDTIGCRRSTVSYTGKKIRRIVDDDFGLPILPSRRRIDRSAKLVGDDLETIADAENGNAKIEELRGRMGCTGIIDACRTSGKDDAPRLERFDLFDREVEGMELGIDAGLTHSARDELGILCTEIENEDQLRMLHGWS